MINLEGLNEKQKQAITSELGPCLVIAGAGSGKTKVLTMRYAYLVDTLNFDPQNILAITFTNKAANEMKERLGHILDGIHPEWVGTFHSICLRILKEDIQHLNRPNNFMIVDDEDQIAILKEAYRKYEIDLKEIPYKNMLSFIERVKNNRLEKADILSEKNWGMLSIKNKRDCTKKIFAYEHYCQICLNENLLDFNDLLLLTNNLFKASPDVLQKWQSRFEYILVDEFQDTNDEQYQFILSLTKTNKNIFAVGDPDQMIYSWRGANLAIINNFPKQFSGCKIVILDINYRSGQPILNVANHLIKNNINRFNKDLTAFKQINYKPLYFTASSQDEESRWVVQKILNLINNERVSLDNICILYRSNYLSRNIEQELFINSIPYTVYGGTKFYQRKEIKDVLSYLKAIYLRDELSIKRIINIPKRGISNATIATIEDFARKNKISFADGLLRYEELELSTIARKGIESFLELVMSIPNNESLIKTVNIILDKTGYIDHLKNIDEHSRIKNVEELVNSIAKYETDNPANTFVDYLQEISLYTDNDTKTKNSLSLMTVHTSKGLEFDYIFLIGFNDGIFPSKQSVDSEERIEEERRIAYVAITRAKMRLYISSFSGLNYITNTMNKPSRFIGEIRKDFLDSDTMKIKSISKLSDNDWYDSKAVKNYRDNYNENSNEVFHIGDKVVHTIFGEGIVMAINNDILDVAFKPPFNRKSVVSNHKSLKRKYIVN